ncbi:MAG: XRE family transcriptional regulator [Clostridiales bacterium 43-6]|nr:MAG: XRE family transcriptional regulator [Clostridiales bacterium 43-6]
MEPKIAEIATRIKGLREMLELSVSETAYAAGMSEQDYTALEAGESDFSFSALFKIAETFGVDMIVLLTGENPHLSNYSVVRGGNGLPISRREGFSYFHLAANFKNKFSEPFLVKAPYRAEEQNKEIHLSRHEGQEFNYILKGSLKIIIEGHSEILTAGDSVIYDSGKGHGMIAVSEEGCEFLAIILKKQGQE